MSGQRNILSRATSGGMIGLVRAYQLGLSPWFGHACRFQPTCSAYAIEAIRAHGPAKGGALAAWRIARCNPFGGSGYDPVPSALNAQAHEKADDPHHPA